MVESVSVGSGVARVAGPERPTALRRNGPTLVYRLYDTDDLLLYVGLSLSVAQRLAQHHLAPWWEQVAKVEVERFATRDEARDRERVCIQTMQPTYNRNGHKEIRPSGAKRGRPRIHTEQMVNPSVSMPRSLRDQIRRDVLARNEAAGDPEAWKFSRVVVDILRQYFAQQESGNGR